METFQIGFFVSYFSNLKGQQEKSIKWYRYVFWRIKVGPGEGIKKRINEPSYEDPGKAETSYIGAGLV